MPEKQKNTPPQPHPDAQAPQQREPAPPGHQPEPQEQKTPRKPPVISPADEVEEALLGSFPASDPPGYGTGHA